MAVTRISIVTPDAKEADQGAINAIANDASSVERLAEFVKAVGNGSKTGKIRLNTGAVQAEGQIAFDSFAEDDTITINGVVLTGKTSPSGASQFAVGASDEACANNVYSKLIASALDKIVGLVVPFRRGTIVVGSIVTTNTVTINGVVFTAKTTPDTSDRRQFLVGTTSAKTAENLLNAIIACRDLYPEQLGAKLLSVTRSTATLTIDYDGVLTFANSANATLDNDMVRIRSAVGGQIGNLMTLAISARGSVSGAALENGTEGTEVLFSKNRSIL